MHEADWQVHPGARARPRVKARHLAFIRQHAVGGIIGALGGIAFVAVTGQTDLFALGAFALLAATGNFEEIPMHIRASLNTGASKDDVMEAFLHVAIYAGVPKANHAIKLAKATYKELEEEPQ